MPPRRTVAMRSRHVASVPILAAVLESTAARTRSGRSAASPCATTPPIESPTKTASRDAEALHQPGRVGDEVAHPVVALRRVAQPVPAHVVADQPQPRRQERQQPVPDPEVGAERVGENDRQPVRITVLADMQPQPADIRHPHRVLPRPSPPPELQALVSSRASAGSPVGSRKPKPLGPSVSALPTSATAWLGAPSASASPATRASTGSAERLKTQASASPVAFPQVRQHRPSGLEEALGAQPQRRARPPERQHRAVEGERRRRIPLLAGDRPRRLRRLDRQPGPPGGEAAVRLGRVPGHRRAAAVAALVFRPEGDARRVGQLLELELGLGEAQLLPLVDPDRAAERQQHRRRQPRQLVLVAGVVAPAGDVADHVVVGEAPARPAVRRPPEEALDPAAEMLRR